MTRAVVKPLQSAGSVGVTMCDTVDEAMAAVKNLFSAQDFFGRKQTCCLIQERYGNTAASAGVQHYGAKTGRPQVCNRIKKDVSLTPQNAYAIINRRWCRLVAP